LTITKSINVTVVNPGNEPTYTLVIKNIGDGPATNVVVTDTLPAGLTYVVGGGTIKSWNLGTMAPGETRTISYQVHVWSHIKAGTYKTVAVAKADDVDPISASATVTVKVPEVLGLATTGVSPRDYVIFSIGLLLASAGFVLLKRNR